MSTVMIECKLVNRRRDGSALCIEDGTQEVHPIYPGEKMNKQFWIPVKMIEDSSPDIRDMDIGDEIELEISEWFATEKGLV